MPTLDRRELLSGAIAGAVVASQCGEAPAEEASLDERPMVIDTNVSLFQWPFRRLPLDETDALVRKLRSHAIRRAWASSYEGLLHRDVAGVNARLARECREHGDGLLVPFGVVNPGMVDWEEDLRRCHEEHRMPGVRLYPNYHGYKLDDQPFHRLLEMATERRLVVQLAVAMEDRRTQHAMLQTPDVNLGPIRELMLRTPKAQVVILNHKAIGADFLQLSKTPGVYFELSRVNATDGVARVLRTSPDRIVFGSHAPFLIYEAAMIKVYESDLTKGEMSAVLHQNADRLVSWNH